MTDESRIPTNLRMLKIIEALSAHGREVAAAELDVDLPKPTLHRLCATLESEGFVIRDRQSGKLRPGTRALQMANGLQAISPVHIARHQLMKAVATEIRETLNLATAATDGMVYLDRVDTPWPLRFQLPIGTEVPFHCTASGKMFLASLSKHAFTGLLGSMTMTSEAPNTITDPERLRDEIAAIRKADYSWDNQEFMAGMVAFAVPIRDPEGRFACALAFHAPEQRIGFEEGRAYVPILRAGADRIAAVMFDNGDS